jgi:hypothetical protein
LIQTFVEAWRTHNKHHDNPVEEDSDSELSVLSSSLFNGIEGIEMGGVMGTEMGGDSEAQVNAGSNSTVTSLTAWRETRRAEKNNRYFDFKRLKLCVHINIYYISVQLIYYCHS